VCTAAGAAEKPLRWEVDEEGGTRRHGGEIRSMARRSASVITELVIGQARDKAQVASILRQTITGKAGFIASSKNKTWKQTKVLSESDVYLSSPPEPAQLSDAQLNSIQ
jgi:hypothetical protein